MRRVLVTLCLFSVATGCTRIFGSYSFADPESPSDLSAPALDLGRADLAPPESVVFSTSGCTRGPRPCEGNVVMVISPGPPDAGSAVRYEVTGTIAATGDIVVQAGVVVSPAPYTPPVSDGALHLVAPNGSISIAEGAALDASGRGYGGGGGGGGQIHGDANFCGSTLISPGGATGAVPEGEPGNPTVYALTGLAADCVRAGGRGGGFGGATGGVGTNSTGTANGSGKLGGHGGQGGGPSGGLGGGDSTDNASCNDFLGCGNRQAVGAPGRRGGYRAIEINGESAEDLKTDVVWLGSGGGGGAGAISSSSFCCGGGIGGSGGVAGLIGACGVCTSGGGGSGGGAGGGTVVLEAVAIVLEGALRSDGAGEAALGAGYGAGGGVLLKSSSLTLGPKGRISSLGGNASGAGQIENGGTVKLRYVSLFAPPQTAARITAGIVSASAPIP